MVRGRTLDDLTEDANCGGKAEMAGGANRNEVEIDEVINATEGSPEGEGDEAACGWDGIRMGGFWGVEIGTMQRWPEVVAYGAERSETDD